jgi:glycosyltransferase involved in cell wall biosynthesis
MLDIIVSAYKQEKYLKKCLDSILDQEEKCNIYYY